MKTSVRQAVTPYGLLLSWRLSNRKGNRQPNCVAKKVSVCLVGGYRCAIMSMNIILTNVFKIQQIKSVLTNAGVEV